VGWLLLVFLSVSYRCLMCLVGYWDVDVVELYVDCDVFLLWLFLCFWVYFGFLEWVLGCVLVCRDRFRAMRLEFGLENVEFIVYALMFVSSCVWMFGCIMFLVL